MRKIYLPRFFTPKAGGPPCISLFLVAVGHVSAADTVYFGYASHSGGGPMTFALNALHWLVFSALGQATLVVGSILWILFVAFKPRRQDLGASTSLRAGDLRYLADEARNFRVEYECYLQMSLAGHEVLSQPLDNRIMVEVTDKDFRIQDLAMLQFRARLHNHISNIRELWASLGWFARKYYSAPPAIVRADGTGTDYWKEVLRSHEIELRSMLRR
jgi:hypothetical protein